jgi:MFS family permease
VYQGVRKQLGFLLFCLGTLFALSTFYRFITAVIADELVRELSIDAKSLGIMGAGFFYAMAFFQILIGPMLDRIGPRKIITLFALIGSAGTILFSLATTFTGTFSGRILMGIGMAPVFIGSLKVFSMVLPKDKFSRFTGLMVSVGAIGSILATSPFAYLNSILGWRNVLLLVAGITLMFALLIFHLLKKTEIQKTNAPAVQSINVLQSLKIIFGSLLFWKIAGIVFCRYGTQVALQGLWLGLYLIEVEGYSTIQAGNILFFLAIGASIGSPLVGWFYDKTQYYKKNVIMAGLSIYCACFIPLVISFNNNSALFYGIIVFFIGFFGGFGMLPYSEAKDFFPSSLSGTAIAWVNISLVTGGAVFTHLLGKIIECFPRVGYSYPPIAYRVAFGVCFLSILAALMFYAFPHKTGNKILPNEDSTAGK